MKTMTCKQLGGACSIEFHAGTFEEMAELSKNHAMEKLQMGDEKHIMAMNKMKELMKSAEAMNKWYEKKRTEFDSLPQDK